MPNKKIKTEPKQAITYTKDELKAEAVILEKMKPEPNEILIMKYNLDKIDIEEAKGVYDYITDIFSHNKIIVIPDDITLTRFDKEELIDIYDHISNLIEEL